MGASRETSMGIYGWRLDLCYGFSFTLYAFCGLGVLPCFTEQVVGFAKEWIEDKDRGEDVSGKLKRGHYTWLWGSPQGIYAYQEYRR